MSNNPANVSRRRALKMVAGAAAVVPLSTLITSRSALAADLPHVAEDDPVAVGVKYVHDATKANRVDKAGVAAAEQHCLNCNFAQATEGEWLPCQIFPGKAVNANGWCTAWAPKLG
jgi:hypothetical protein